MADRVSVTVSVSEGTNQQVVELDLDLGALCEAQTQPSMLRLDVSALAIRALEQAMSDAGYALHPASTNPET